MQKVRSHSLGRGTPGPTRAPTACQHTISGSLSLALPASFSPFPHGTGPLSVMQEYLVLGDGPPGFPQGCSGPAVLGHRRQGTGRIWATGLSPALVRRSRRFAYVATLAPAPLLRRRLRPLNPSPPTPAGFQGTGLDSSLFARRY
jgi:hypothetical protein